MMNTHILSQEFEYFEPKTVNEAILLLATHGEKAKVLAGGTDLLVQMKMQRLHPEVVINIAKIPALRYLNEEKGLSIGSLTPFREVEQSPAIRTKYEALAEAARAVSSVQIKNMGTLGGNLCHGSPAADSAPPLIAFGAKVKLVGAKGERIVPLESFFIGPGKTILLPSELLVGIEVPEVRNPTGSAFLKLARVSADLAKVSVAVATTREKDVCSGCRIVLGAVGMTPLRAGRAEEVLKGKPLGAEAVKRAALEASEEIQPITDIRSTAWYRKEVSKVLVRDALLLAWKRCGGTVRQE
jgi:CO/xanthine dehydrogenase FAD-binding subunit